jgi:hypothetical protein
MTKFSFSSILFYILLAAAIVFGVQATMPKFYSGPKTIVIEDDLHPMGGRINQDSNALIPAKVLNDTIKSKFDDIKIIRKTVNPFDRVTVTVYKPNGTPLRNPQTQTLTPIVHQGIVEYPILILNVPNNHYAYKFKCEYHSPRGNQIQTVIRYVHVHEHN